MPKTLRLVSQHRRWHRADGSGLATVPLPLITAVTLQIAESLELPVVLERIAQQLAGLFDGVCHVHFTPARRPADARSSVATPPTSPNASGGDATMATPLVRPDASGPTRADQPTGNGHRALDMRGQAQRGTTPGSALLIAPLIARGRRLGVIEVMLPAPDDERLRQSQLLLHALAAHAALALDTADQMAHRGSGPEVDGDVPQKTDLAGELPLIAHDLRSLLTALSTSLQLISRLAAQEAALDHTRVARLASLATSAVEQLEQQITALSPAPAAGARGNLPPASSVDLITVAQRLATFYQLTSGQHQITVTADLPALPGPWVRSHLERVIGNLLTNAIKYSRAGSEIRVSVGQEDDELGHWATLRVDSRGRGIPMQDLAQITRAGSRGSNVGSLPGMGLGLASVREVVAQCGGSLAIQSEVGGTTAVQIRLPLASTPGIPAAPSVHWASLDT